jgi:thymidylate kinase/glycosyltransferase involved in cell wall biosynthesis
VRVVVVTELDGRAGEGMRAVARDLVRAFGEAGHEASLLRLAGDPRRAALRPAAWRELRRARPDVLHYVPYSGLTTASLVRLAALRAAAPGAVAGISVLQAASRVAGVRVADVALFASARLRRLHGGVARSTAVVPPVVDLARFVPGPRPPGRSGERLALHVGHLHPRRTLEALAAVARRPGWRVVMLASTTVPADPEVRRELERAGVEVRHGLVPDVERWYQACDAYVFCVEHPQGAIEVPLSVLEALACDVPVATTPFGGLPELFPPGPALAYAPADRLGDALDGLAAEAGGANRAAVEGLTPTGLAAAVGAAYAGRSARGRLVVLSGIDGAGKSTQAARLRDWGRGHGVSVEVVWGRWDPWLAKPLVRLLDRATGSRNVRAPGEGERPEANHRRRRVRERVLGVGALRAGWRALMVVDYGLRLAPAVRRARARADLVVLDRYWPDVLVDQSAGGGLADPPALLLRLLPAADRVTVLDLPEAGAMARQPESPDLVYLRDRRRLYRELAARGDALLVDGSQPAERVTDALLEGLGLVNGDGGGPRPPRS